MQVVSKNFLQSMGLKCLVVWLFFCCCWSAAYGALDATLYQGEVPLASYSADDREKALGLALQQVLVKISHNQDIAQLDVVRKALIKAEALVVSYNYVGGADPKSLALQVRFSPKAVDALLQTVQQVKMDKRPSSDHEVRPVVALPAVPSGHADLLTVQMVVSNVTGLQNYADLLDYLQRLDGVVEVNSKQTRDDRVLLMIQLNKPLNAVVGSIDDQQKLLAQPLPDVANAPQTLLSYRWVGADSVPAANNQMALPITASSQPISVAVPSLLPRVSVEVTPVVEGVPAVASGVDVSLMSDEGQARAFALSPLDQDFNVEPGKMP